MAGDQPPDRHHQPPDVETTPSHPNITSLGGGNDQIAAASYSTAAQLAPATTRNSATHGRSQTLPDPHTNPSQPVAPILDVRIAGSGPPPGSQLPGGSKAIPAEPGGVEVADHLHHVPGILALTKDTSIAAFGAGIKNPQNSRFRASADLQTQIPATSSRTTVAQPHHSTPGSTGISKDLSIAQFGADLQNPQFLDCRVFPGKDPSIRRAQAQIGKKELHICDPHAQTSRLALVSSDSAPVNFPAKTAGAPPATAVPATGKNPAAPVCPTASKKQPPSLAQVVSASKRISIPTFVTESFPDREVTVHRGLPAVRFNESEVSDLALIDKYILVGKFSHGQPKLEVIKNHFATNYVFRGSVSVGWRDSKHVFILFSNSHDCSTMLLEGTLFFPGDYPMRLFRWTPDFDPEVETSLAPAWILFYGLPLHMFNFHALSLICKPIGKLLGVDKVTLAREKPHVARVCVEVDLLKPLLKEIFVGTSEVEGNEDCGFAQSVVYERLPYYCEYCLRQGHSLDRCKLKAQDSKSEAQNLPTPQPNSKPKPQVPLHKPKLHAYVPKAHYPKPSAPSQNPTHTAQDPHTNHPLPQNPFPAHSQTPATQNPTTQNPLVRTPSVQNPQATPSAHHPGPTPSHPSQPGPNPSARTLTPFAQAFPSPKPQTPSSAQNPNPKTPSTLSAVTRTPQSVSPNPPAQTPKPQNSPAQTQNLPSRGPLSPSPNIRTPSSQITDWQVKTRKGSRPVTEGELDLLEASASVPESSVVRCGERFHVHRLYEDSSFLEDFFDSSSPTVSPDKGKGKAPCTPPMICTLNRSPDTIPSNKDFGIKKSARSRFLEPGPSRGVGGSDTDDDYYPYASEGETSEDEWARPYDPYGYMETFRREIDMLAASPPRITPRTRHRRLYDSS